MPEYIYDIDELEKSPHRSPEDKELYWLDSEHTKLTDGFRVYPYIKGQGVLVDQPIG